MISYLRGQIVRKSPTELVIDVGGVGYAVTIPLSTFAKLEKSNGNATILTYLHVREDIMQLYGFATEQERELFRLLISISGIGPKMAQGILSGLDPQQLKDAIVGGNIPALTAVAGVGRKTAERIVMELRDRLAKDEILNPPTVATSVQLKARSEAIIALMSLGHSRSTAEHALNTASSGPGARDLSVEELIKLALRHTGR
jgi:Holliday junction DNA helicase RuvA